MKTLLRNGLIVDGTGNKAYKGSLILEGTRIKGIVKGDVPGFEGHVINCEGLVIAPGLIDAHGHIEWFLEREHEYHKFYGSYLQQGLTTIIGGNCGDAMAGYAPNSPWAEQFNKGPYWEGVGMEDFSDWGFWADWAQKRTPINISTCVGLGIIRRSMTYYDPTPLNDRQMKQLEEILDRSMDQGAWGASLALMYAPSEFATWDELKLVGRTVAKHNKILSVHARSLEAISTAYPYVEGGTPHNILALDEILRLAEETGCKLEYSHAVLPGKICQEHNDELLERLDKAVARGIDVTFDLFSPFNGATILYFFFPPWYKRLSKEERKDPAVRRKFREEFEWKQQKQGFGLEDVRIFCAKCPEIKEFEGMYLPEIAERLGMDQFDAYMQLCDWSDSEANILDYNQYTYETLSKQAWHPLSMYMTDSWVVDSPVQNPASYGGLARFIELSRSGITPPLEMTIHKMTGKTADRFGLRKRGKIAEGNFADLTIFDYENVRTHFDTGARTEGIKHVFVSGTHVVDNEMVMEDRMRGAGYIVRV